MAKKSNPRSGWGWVKTAGAIAKPSDTEKQHVLSRFAPHVQHLNDNLPPLEEPQCWNQAVAVGSRWRGNYFYLYTTYKVAPHPDALRDSFEMGIARLAYKRPGVYDLAYFRHTGQWFTVWYDLPVEACLEIVKGDGIFSV